MSSGKLDVIIKPLGKENLGQFKCHYRKKTGKSLEYILCLKSAKENYNLF